MGASCSADEEEKGQKLIEKFKKLIDPESEHYAPDDVDKNNENLEKVQVKLQMYDVC